MTATTIPTTIPVAIYASVSTDKQGDSIEHQVSFLREYVSRNLGEGYYTDDTLTYSDEGIGGYSTTILDRPAMKQLLNDAKKDLFKVVLIKELTRFGRDDEDNSRAINILEASDVRVRSNDGYDTEQQHTKMLLKFILAESESERISTRVAIGFREVLEDFRYRINIHRWVIDYIMKIII